MGDGGKKESQSQNPKSPAVGSDCRIRFPKFKSQLWNASPKIDMVKF